MTTQELQIAKEWQSETKESIITALSTNQYWNDRKQEYNESPCMEIIASVFNFSNDDFVREICEQYIENKAIAYMTEEEANVIYDAFMKL